MKTFNISKLDFLINRIYSWKYQSCLRHRATKKKGFKNLSLWQKLNSFDARVMMVDDGTVNVI